MAHFYGIEQFFGVVGRAANVGHGHGNYTLEMFQEDFPQFFKKETGEDGETAIVPFLPETVLQEIINQANASLQPDKWLEGWRYAVGLYVAHYATLYLRNFSEDPQTASQAAATGSVSGVVKRATLGDASVDYDTEAVTKALEEWGDFNSTSYGQQLATRARLVGMGGMGVI